MKDVLSTPKTDNNVIVKTDDISLYTQDTVDIVAEMVYETFYGVKGMKSYNFVVSGNDDFSERVHESLKKLASGNDEFDERIKQSKFHVATNEEIDISPKKELSCIDYVVHVTSSLFNGKDYFRDSRFAIFDKNGYIANLRKQGGKVDYVISAFSTEEADTYLEDKVNVQRLFPPISKN